MLLRNCLTCMWSAKFASATVSQGFAHPAVEFLARARASVHDATLSMLQRATSPWQLGCQELEAPIALAGHGLGEDA